MDATIQKEIHDEEENGNNDDGIFCIEKGDNNNINKTEHKCVNNNNNTI